MAAIISRCPLLNEGERITLIQLMALADNGVKISEYDFAEARGVSETTVQNHIKKLKGLEFIRVSYNPEIKKSTYRCRKGTILKKLKIPSNLRKGVEKNDRILIKKAYSIILHPEFRARFTRRAHVENIMIPMSDRDARFLTRTRSKYTNQDIIRYFRVKYRESFRRDHRGLTKYDKTLCTELLKSSDSKEICDTIDFALIQKAVTSSLDFPTFCRSFPLFYKKMAVTSAEKKAGSIEK